MATVVYTTTSSFGALVAQSAGNAATSRATLQRVVNAMLASAGSPFDAAKIASNPDFGVTDATAAQALFDGCNGLLMAMTTGSANAGVNALDKGA